MSWVISVCMCGQDCACVSVVCVQKASFQLIGIMALGDDHRGTKIIYLKLFTIDGLIMCIDETMKPYKC